MIRRRLDPSSEPFRSGDRAVVIGLVLLCCSPFAFTLGSVVGWALWALAFSVCFWAVRSYTRVAKQSTRRPEPGWSADGLLYRFED